MTDCVDRAGVQWPREYLEQKSLSSRVCVCNPLICATWLYFSFFFFYSSSFPVSRNGCKRHSEVLVSVCTCQCVCIEAEFGMRESDLHLPTVQTPAWKVALALLWESFKSPQYIYIPIYLFQCSAIGNYTQFGYFSEKLWEHFFFREVVHCIIISHIHGGRQTFPINC